MIKGIGIFTSGKGGVGKTPYALLFSLLLRRKGNNVLVLDYNFLNPDLFDIFRRMSEEKIEVLTEVNGKRLPHPLSFFTLYLPNGGKIYVAARIQRFRYLPYPPFTIFQSINALREHIGEDFYAIVDTNLNITSFNTILPDMVEAVTKSLELFGKINFYHIWSISIFRRGTTADDKSEIELIRSTVKNFSQRGLNIFGRDGERIVHIISPRIFGVQKKGLGKRFASIMKGITGKKESDVVALDIEEKKFLEKYLEKLSNAYERSTRFVTLAELEEFEKDFDKMVKLLLSENPRYLLEADPFDIETLFLSFMIEKLYDKNTVTMPLNAIIIPYMIKKLINFVDVLLLSDIIEEEAILSRESPATEIIDTWILKSLAADKFQ